MSTSMSPYQSFIATGYKPAMYKGEDVSGQTKGGYIVQGLAGSIPHPHGTKRNWAVVCVQCNKLYIITQHSVLRNKTGCNACASGSVTGSASPHWKGYGDVPATFLAALRPNRKTKTLEMTLSLEYLNDLWIRQDKKCAYTGWELQFGSSNVEQTASLDRIDSSVGYIPGNVQFVHKDINIMKGQLSHTRFIEICTTIARNQEK